MELRSHAKLIKKNGWFIAVFTVLVGIMALVFALVRPVQYKAVVSFDVDFVNRPETQDYQYGGFYDLKGAELYTQDLMSWFKTPAFVVDIYETAGFEPYVDNVARFTNRFQTKQYSALNFVVIFTDPSRENALKLSEAIITLVERGAGKAGVEEGKEGGEAREEGLFSVQALDPVVAESRFPVWLVTTVGALAGFILSLILVYLREYFRE